MTALKLIRCAIYTRKSSEEGLDQAFNSLHAQREACEAYIKSQAAEGWRALKTAYDDGGFSGGNMERPALRQLLTDVEAGLIDTIVVYKIDRLTRSLTDFARIVDRLEVTRTSFVSVTQAFNTTTSMGRLTLNVLLSFAQFEREVTGERIRDKIAASKKKGMWMGGTLPLGYDAPLDPQTRALVVNAGEAATVVSIFEAYLELGSVSALQGHLDSRGVRSKVVTAGSGKVTGGVQFSRGALYHLLKNRVYAGEITHRSEVYPGAHAPIVPPELFASVQSKLASQRHARRSKPPRAAAMPLRGLLFDAAGQPMSPTFAYGKGGRIYRYYVSAPLQQGSRARACEPALRRLSAPAFEELIASELRARFNMSSETPLPHLLKAVRRLDLIAEGYVITFSRKALSRSFEGELSLCEDDPSCGELHIQASCRVRGGRTWISRPAKRERGPKQDPVLIRGLRRAHRLAAKAGWNMNDATLGDINALAPDSMYDRRLCRLAFLAPDLQRMILEGRQPENLTLDGLRHTDLSLDWTAQRALFDASA